MLLENGNERWHKFFIGQYQQHTYWLYKVIDDVLRLQPSIRNFVEIGTGNGALSLVFGMHAVRRGGNFLTMDIKRRHLELVPVFDRLGILALGGCCFENQDTIMGWIGDKPVFFFCDGGDKTKEFNTFAPLLNPGSVICAHDYPVEITPESIEGTVKDLSLIPIMEEEWFGGVDDIQCCFYRVPA